MAAVFVAGAAFAHAERLVSVEAPEVELTLPPIEEPKPEPEPPPPPQPEPVKAPPPPVAKPHTQAPPREEPPSDPSPGNGIGPGSGEPGLGTGAGTGPQRPAPPPAITPPPPKPLPIGPVQLPENATAPVALSKPSPVYPEAARTEGIEMTVVVKYVVTERGDVTNVRILKGHPLLDADVMRVVKSWRFSPAMHEGHPIAVFHVSRIPFVLKK